VGQSKAETAAAFINKRVYGVQVKHHHARIENFGDDFYSSFHIVVSGLDNVNARRWLNIELLSLAVLKRGSEDTYEPSTLLTCINGGTEGWKGETRVITPYKTPCFECLVHLFPKDPYNFPICTTADKPRSPEHCIVYAMEKEWPKVHGEKKIDGDNEDNVKFVMEAAKIHAAKFSLDVEAVNYRLTQGVVKRIIPAIASTNACISASCASEAFKIVTGIYSQLENFSNYSGAQGCYSFATNNEKNAACLVCGGEALDVHFPGERTLEDFVHYIKKDKDVFQFYHSPILTWDEDGLEDDEESHEYDFIYTVNTKMYDTSMLKKRMDEIFKAGECMYLSQSQKKNNESGQSVIDCIKENKLRITFTDLSEWLKGHQEFVDEWGSEVDKIAFKKLKSCCKE
jgi:ubiquitin-activating enzyme E1 C